MWLKSFRIRNYKSFCDSQMHSLAPKRNVIVGTNNSGKSALLEALSLKYSNHPHKTAARKVGFPLPLESEIEFEFSVTGVELRRFLLTFGGALIIPCPVNGVRDPHSATNWLNSALAREEITFLLRRRGATFEAARYPAFDVFARTPGACFGIQVNANQAEENFKFTGFTSAQSDFAPALGGPVSDLVYFFNAERLAIAQCAVGPSYDLRSNAGNLAEVLQNLQALPFRFQEFMGLVNYVLPDIKQVGAANISSQQVEVRVSSYGPTLGRDDLFVSLKECGTGVGQVLAILYVLVASRNSRVIIIDEPNSFLHPGAVRRLLDVVRRYDRHQFIISTHSPDVISASDPEQIILTRWVENQTVVEASKQDQVTAARAAIAEVGARLSDVFGADHILWVEGATEERCFPYIIQHLLRPSLIGTAILGVPATGDLHGRRKKLVLDIYRKLSASSVLLPVALAFLFDRERLTDDEVAAASKESGGLLEFIPRYCFENYLISVPAITEVLNAEEAERSEVTQDEVSAWLAENAERKSYLPPEAPKYGTPEWHRKVDAASLLGDLFWELRTVAYSKVKHSFDLTRIICDKSRDEFSELLELIQKLLPEEKGN
ncbi:MAG: AAA family ATPase [Alphaproteobacteria bacterium]|nr:AAA family ATPase [Alphaproteobacteria bacterium]